MSVTLMLRLRSLLQGMSVTYGTETFLVPVVRTRQKLVFPPIVLGAYEEVPLVRKPLFSLLHKIKVEPLMGWHGPFYYLSVP